MEKLVGTTKRSKPVIVKWNGAEMFEHHSIRPLAHTLADLACNVWFVQVDVIGTTGHDEPELCYTLAHMIHRMLENDCKYRYGVRYMNEHHLYNVPEVFSDIGTPTIAVVDNISSFKATVSGRKFNRVMESFLVVRRYTKRAILLMNYRFSADIPQPLRGSSEMQIYLSLSSKDKQSLLKIVGNKHAHTLERFSNLSRIARTEGKWVMERGDSRVKYKWRDPFMLAMVVKYNEPKLIVFPLRTWIDPQCSVCDKEYVKLRLDEKDIIPGQRAQFRQGEDDNLPLEADAASRGIDRAIPEREDMHNEFKEIFSTQMNNNKSNKIKMEVAIAVAALANAEGGRLFVGVRDNGKPVGLLEDLKQYKNSDGLELAIRDFLVNKLDSMVDVNFYFSREDYLVITIPKHKTGRWVYTKDGDFHVRYGNQSRKLNSKQTAEYQNSH